MTIPTENRAQDISALARLSFLALNLHSKPLTTVQNTVIGVKCSVGFGTNVGLDLQGVRQHIHRVVKSYHRKDFRVSLLVET